ncbi:Calpain-2 catalytic subunit [Channa argus]|uniref:Calpain-2 catalytic subunit n=1 Tax=Channa argus TaxID=215402 RepID=A0A6G1QFW2_CHAAH|nr:Calpain-2 catalytic subunit [Channa argus]
MPAPGVCLNIIEARHKRDGYGTINNPDWIFNQDYHKLREHCLRQRVNYIDDMFPPDERSIGNCWFLASIGALTFQRHVLEQVVPLEQTFNDNYCGLFHFKFWRFGKWVDVVIDDKLPTINGRLIFVHSKDPNEFWPALLEKAYAKYENSTTVCCSSHIKVCGSYTDMNAGTPAEAMMDFTGGVHVCIQLSNPPPNLWQLMYRAGKSKTLMGCGTPQGDTPANKVLPNGLVQGHAYTVTGVKQVLSRGKLVSLVRLWNPWGHGEWNGDWSDQMTIEDFCKYYVDLDICGLSPDFLDGNSTAHWKTSMYEGRWVAGTTAGGCTNNSSFWTNPQYRVKVDGQYSDNHTEKNVLISLIQKPDKRNRRLVQNLHIGFYVFEYKQQKWKLPATFFNTHTPVAQTKLLMNAREVMELLVLKPGDYLIVPSTYNPNEMASFILTIYSKAETHGYENSGDHRHDEVKKDIFFRTDVSRTGTLSLSELRNAFVVAGVKISDDMLNLMALRYGASSGHMTLESFISLVLRLDCMHKIFKQLSEGGSITLRESEASYVVLVPVKSIHRVGNVHLSFDVFITPAAVMVRTIVLACSMFQVLTVLRLDKEETSTDGATEVIWLIVKPEESLPRATEVSVVMF